jgi:15-cis-phytoene synthase
MQLQTHAWESALLLRAYEAHHPAPSHSQSSSQFPPKLLEQAYAHCDSITSYHSKSFYLASSLLPADKRRAVRALYAFCRITDDIVDCGVPQREVRLALWRDRVLDPNPPEDDYVAVAWADARTRFHIPPRYAEQLIDGVAQDLTPPNYETFGELAAYSYGVASTVGLMSMHIIGYASHDAIPYAIKLGVALQITNILRDVGDDLRSDRVYLPREELVAFAIDEEELTRGIVSARWREFMRFQIDRNRRLYREAMPGIGYLNRNGRFAIGAAAELYEGILTEIEAADYNVFNRRAAVSATGKLSRLPGIWWRVRNVP